MMKMPSQGLVMSFEPSMPIQSLKFKTVIFILCFQSFTFLTLSVSLDNLEVSSDLVEIYS